MFKKLFKCEKGEAFELERVSAVIWLEEVFLPSAPKLRYTGWAVVLMSRVETTIPITDEDYKRIMRRRGENA